MKDRVSRERIDSIEDEFHKFRHEIRWQFRNFEGEPDRLNRLASRVDLLFEYLNVEIQKPNCKPYLAKKKK